MAGIPKDLRQLVDPQLLGRRRRVPRATNARLLWERELPTVVPGDCSASSHLDIPDGDCWFGRFEPAEELKGWLATHHHDLATLERGLELGEFQLALERSKSRPLLTPLLTRLRLVCEARELRARLLAQDGHSAAAAREATVLLEVGELMIRGCDHLFGFLLLLERVRRGLASVRGVLRMAPQDDRVLAGWLESIAGGQAELDGMTTAFVGEFRDELLPCLTLLDGARNQAELVRRYADVVDPPDSLLHDNVDHRPVIRGLASLLRDHPRPFDLGATVELASRCFAACLESRTSPWIRRSRFPVAEMRPVEALWPGWLAPSWQPGPGTSCSLTPARARRRIAAIDNPAGKILISGITGALELTLQRTCLVRAERVATTLLLALELHQRRCEEVPALLRELVEHQILLEIPRDPVTGGTPGYCPHRSILWLSSPEKVNRRYTLDPIHPRPEKDMLVLLPPWLHRTDVGDLESLPELERLVVELVHGFEGGEPVTIDEIAENLHVEEADVRLLLANALDHMAHAPRGDS